MWEGWRRRRRFKSAQELYEKGKYEAALPLFEELAAAGYRPAEVALFRAATLFGMKKYGEARQTVEPLCAAPEPGALVHYLAGKIAAAEGDWEKAFALAKRAFAQDSFNTRIEYFLGICYLQRGDAEQAADHFESAIRYDRQLVDSRLLLLAETVLLRGGPGAAADKIFF